MKKSLKCINVAHPVITIDLGRLGFFLRIRSCMPIGELLFALIFCPWPVQIHSKASAADDVQAQLHAVVGDLVDADGRLGLMGHPTIDH